MKRLTLLTLVLLCCISTFRSYSQQQCCADHQHNLFLESEGNQTKFSLMNEKILHRIIERRASNFRDEETCTVPVVVHVIHENGLENISEQQVNNAIDWLNEAYSNTNGSFNPDGIAIPIQFCLVKRDPDGEFTTGINYVNSNLTNMLVPSQDLELKNISRWNPTQYLNIWVVNSITREPNSPGVIGYATFPDAHGTEIDGIVIEADNFGSTEVANNAFIHETGHYLGLFHTFQGGCPNDDCLTSGDMVCDTPPDQNLFNIACFDGTNSCTTDEDDTSLNNPFRAETLGGLGDQFDQQANYMDYSNVYCFDIFTEGQSERMIAAITEIRSSLLEDDKCSPPCEDPIIVDVTASADIIDVGESITFTNSSTNFTTSEWTLDGVSVSNSSEYIFTPSVQGEYFIELELTNSDPGCYQFIPFPVDVNCPIHIEIIPNTTNVSEGGTVEFSVTTTGASEFEWFVDNVSVATSENLSYTFNDIGTSSVFLIASNGLCEVRSQVWNISVGSCTSGNENNIWHWNNPSGNGFGFDFNDQPTSLLPENPMLDPGHCKATICDDAGNLLFVSTGVAVYDRNYDLVQNGNELMGDQSSHFGTMFLEVPGDESKYYLFTTSSEDSGFIDGLRYSIIDSEQNGGLGLVTDEKNILVEFTGTEHVNIIKHCNLRDRWLIFYDLPEEKVKSYLITENGISADPVETELDVNFTNVVFSQQLKPSPQGDRLIFDNFLLDFNQSTGEIDNVMSLGLESEVVFAHDFSPNGKILYVISGEDISPGESVAYLKQFDLTLPEDFISIDPYTIPIDPFALGKDLQKGKDNIIYIDQFFLGQVSTIFFPNLLGAAMQYAEGSVSSNATINGFGNFYHAYIAGQDILIDGDEIICAGTEHEFSVFGSDCIDSDIDWEFSGDGTFEINPNQTVSASFPAVGSATLIAKTDSDCGEITDTLHISIISTPELDLGPDIGYCPSNSEIVLEMSDEFNFYYWSTGSTEQSITLESPAPQTIEARGYYQGCFITDEIEILGELNASIDLGPDQELCDGSAIILDAGPGYSDYLWQDGSTGQTYTAFLGGNYSVSVTEPCAASDEIFIDECGQTINSISEKLLNESISIYPNPAEEEFVISLTELTSDEVSLELLDASGRIVLSDLFVPTSTLESKKVSIAHLAAGEYVLSLKSKEFTWQQQLMIK